MPPPTDQDRHAHHLFVVTSNRRDDLQRYLKSKEIDSLIHYPIPVHFQEPCRRLARDPQGLVRTEQHAAACLSIPCHPGLTNEQVDKVTSAINSFGA
jgi:dTDP-4-amino-4,6-dideoxygalactose transaminase